MQCDDANLTFLENFHVLPLIFQFWHKFPMLHLGKNEAVPSFPATHLLRRLRHALDGPLAGLGVEGVARGAQGRVMQSTQL